MTSMNINPISTAHANNQSSETATNYDHIISHAASLYNLPEKLIKSVIKTRIELQGHQLCGCNRPYAVNASNCKKPWGG
ncbi:hypothetical protein QFZ73_000985 [Peribacillus sp. V2I11]|nr:hypothetical protein [Peribacillus sp. V2I11]